MNKVIKITVIGAICLCLAALGVACDRKSTETRSMYDEYVAYAESRGMDVLPYEEWMATLKGERGEKGEPGERGERGEQGAQGPQGPQGERGANGQDGLDGREGHDGVDGRDGRDGLDGRDGRDGIDGRDGRTGFVATDTATLSAALGVDNAYVVLGADVDLTQGVTVTGDVIFADENDMVIVIAILLQQLIHGKDIGLETVVGPSF